MFGNNNKKIRELVEEFFRKMDVSAAVEVMPVKDATVPVEVKMEEPQVLIGQNGETLFEIQHLLKIMMKRRFSESFYVDLDINNYKKKKIEYLREFARSNADEAALSRRERILPPMTPYERRIVHIALAERRDITTESFGEEPRRKVVIRPA